MNRRQVQENDLSKICIGNQACSVIFLIGDDLFS